MFQILPNRTPDQLPLSRRSNPGAAGSAEGRWGASSRVILRSATVLDSHTSVVVRKGYCSYLPWCEAYRGTASVCWPMGARIRRCYTRLVVLLTLSVDRGENSLPGGTSTTSLALPADHGNKSPLGGRRGGAPCAAVDIPRANITTLRGICLAQR